MTESTEKWINIHSFSDLQSAYIIKGALEAEGIPAMIPSDTIQTVYPTTLSWSSIDLYVPESECDRALELLQKNGV
ncbi:MAG: DUF2007 domain-containing protein [Muribaculaceae bacterium]|nr:DUF2007 domain-containing protein [Muribaculaceae bacterium]